MGITGLLPALKSIQKTKHLSEFKGQTIAVDAYVWLHKGVYSCATELAMGKPTHKYVDYAMHRVRLLKHFGIEPYIVFDGGPLPAKRGTESERKQRREENLARGKALVAQGRQSQARDCFVKCIDVTPEMAYQLIKALRAEGVQYVVAPYEADAQLAYLERAGLVSAILTEDSDLLVFGCKNVLFKLDHVTSTVCHISRSDFGSVTTSASESSSINLHGWNDTQFRAMAILSGCDYLPSIAGIGLKTANNLLRKWKTAEAVIRAVMLEGKKSVPKGYLKQFSLAEKCFRFQRVYDPLGEKLVHLTELEGEWDGEADAYVGEDIEPELARDIAMGNADPVTHLPMKDINPAFKPRAFKSLRTAPSSPSKKDKGKEKVVGGILNFFGPNPIIPRDKKATSKASAKPVLTGTSSGKRKLGEIMDQDLANRKQRASPHPSGVVQSKFFSTSMSASHRQGTPRRFSEEPTAGPSRIPKENKENVNATVDDDESDVLSTLSLKANISPTQDLDFDDPEDAVTQEDGYMSPLATYSPEAEELSSPAVHIFSPLRKKKRKSFPQGGGAGQGGDTDNEEHEIVERRRWEDGDDFDVDPVSSPISTTKKKKRRRSYSPTAITSASRHGLRLQTPTRSFSAGNILVAETPARGSPHLRAGDTDVFSAHTHLFAKDGPGYVYRGPDLQSCLGVNDEEEVGVDEITVASRSSADAHVSRLNSGSGSELGLKLDSKSGSLSPLSPSPQTPGDGASVRAAVATKTAGIGGGERVVIDVDALEMEMMEMEAEMEIDLEDPEEKATKIQAETVKSVARGWRMKWAMAQVERDDSSSSSASVTPVVVKSKTKKSQKDQKRRQSAPMTLLTNKLRRNETNVTPLGKHSLANTGTNRPLQQLQQPMLAWSAPPKVRPVISHLSLPVSVSAGKVVKSSGVRPQKLKKRSSLVFFAEGEEIVSCGTGNTLATAGEVLKPRSKVEHDIVDDIVGSSDVEEIVELSEQAWTRLNQFRYR